MSADPQLTMADDRHRRVAEPTDAARAAERWFAARTYRGADYSAERLVAAKDGRRISLVLPAHDEETTVGAMVAALRVALVERVPLLDELVVIDSDSTDATARVAADAGATVHAQGDILPECGHRPGKGEALWKSLAVTTGELVGFLDADLHDFDPRMVVGLFGPLVTTPDLMFVKACYDRPLSVLGGVVPGGGGRVSELVARPLLALYWPELTGFVQPLAGEYAGRRELLEGVPFAGGYGVEIGLLIDLLEACGLDALGQVDLEIRKHRNAPDVALARMAMQIQRTVLERLVRQRRIGECAPPGEELVQYARAASGGFDRVRTAIGYAERPPMKTIRDPRATGAASFGTD